MIIDPDAVRSMDRARKQRPPEIDPPEMLMGTDNSSRVEEDRGTNSTVRARRRRRRRSRQPILSYEYDEDLGKHVDIYV
jgi:hypothetical protein